MKNSTGLNLQPSEAAVLHCASRIYSAHLTTNPKGDEQERFERSIKTAIEMARRIDVLVKSNGEMS